MARSAGPGGPRSPLERAAGTGVWGPALHHGEACPALRIMCPQLLLPRGAVLQRVPSAPSAVLDPCGSVTGVATENSICLPWSPALTLGAVTMA